MLPQTNNNDECACCGLPNGIKYHFSYGIETNYDRTKIFGDGAKDTYRITREYKVLGEGDVYLHHKCIRKRVWSHYMAFYLPLLPWLLFMIPTLAHQVKLDGKFSEEAVAILIGASAIGFPIFYFSKKILIKHFGKTLNVDLRKCNSNYSIVNVYKEQKIELLKNALGELFGAKFTIIPENAVVKKEQAGDF